MCDVLHVCTLYAQSGECDAGCVQSCGVAGEDKRPGDQLSHLHNEQLCVCPAITTIPAGKPAFAGGLVYLTVIVAVAADPLNVNDTYTGM